MRTVRHICTRITQHHHAAFIAFPGSHDECCISREVYGIDVRTLPHEQLHKLSRHVCCCVDERCRSIFATYYIDVDLRRFEQQSQDLGLGSLRRSYNRSRKHAAT